MSKRAWMPLYVGDYLADTGHLNTTQHGAYLLLMMHYWKKGELPDDDKQLAAVTKLPLRLWLDSKETIQAFFHDGWKHKRVDDEIEKMQVSAERRAAAGQKGGLKASINRAAMASNASSNATAEDTAMLQHSHSYSHSSEEKKEKKKDSPLRSDDWPKDYGDLFWKAFPRKTEKLSAMKKLAILRKSGIVTFADLMAGVERYAAATANTDPKYIKHPTTWLNAGCWADELQTGGGREGTGNPRKTGHAAIYAAGLRAARKIVGDGEMAGSADESEFSFGNGTVGGRAKVPDEPAGRDPAGDHGCKSGSEGVLEGEIIAPDKPHAGVSGGWKHH